MSRSFIKDPAATLDYAVNWSAWLAEGETLTDATVTVPAGLTKTSQTVADDRVTVWLSGGTVGQSYPITVHVTTSASRSDERTFYILLRDR